MISCSKCYGNDIEALVWINLSTNEIADRTEEYNCLNCQARVDIIVTPDPEWIEDVTPLKEDDEENQIIPNVSRAPSRGISDD